MNQRFFQKLKNNIFRYLLEFFSFADKIFLLQLNKKFKQLLLESNNLKYFYNVRNSLMQFSFPKLISDNSFKIEEFLSLELRKKKINDEHAWNQLLEVVLFFLAKKFVKDFRNENCKSINYEGNYVGDKVTLFNEERKMNAVYFPSQNQLKAQYYLKKSIISCDMNQISLRIENSIINKKSGKSLAKLINKNKIETLAIENCEITRNGISEFLSYLEEKEESWNQAINSSTLKSFGIRFCYLKDAYVAKIIANLASKNFFNLENLDLSSNEVGRETLSVLLEKSKILRIKKLKLEKCIFLESKNITLLCNYILQNYDLSHLSLLSSDLSERAFLQLTSILNPNLLSLDTLGLSVKNFSQEMFSNFANAIISYKKMRSLKITICNYSVYGLSCISRILSDPDCLLKKLELNKIDFKFSFSKDFAGFVNALITNASLISLSFTECYFSEEQINLIFNIIFYKKLQRFKLTRFKFSLSQELLSKLKFIKKLTFSNNDFSVSDLKEIIISMKNTNFENIETINISDNPFLFPDLLADELLFQIISYCKNLKKLYLKNNFIQQEEQEKLKNLCVDTNKDILLVI